MGMTVFYAKDFLRISKGRIKNFLQELGEADIPEDKLGLMRELALQVCMLTTELRSMGADADQFDEIDLSEGDLHQNALQALASYHIRDEVFDPVLLKNILDDLSGGGDKSIDQINRINALIEDQKKKEKDPEQYDAGYVFDEKSFNEEILQDERESKKHAFEKLVQINEAVKFADPSKALDMDTLYTIFTDPQSEEKHKKAKREKAVLDQKRAKLFNEQFTVLDFWSSCFSLNFDEAAGNNSDEQIKREKAKLLLGEKTETARKFQMEFAREMINKMLALPDEKLFLDTYDDAVGFYLENIRALDMLRNLENWMGGPELNGGIRKYVNIPQHIVDILKHKRDLAAENIFNIEKDILYYASDDYAAKQYSKALSEEEKQAVLKAPGSYKLPESAARDIEKELVSGGNNVLQEKHMVPDNTKDGVYSERRDVKIIIIKDSEYSAMSDMVRDIKDTVNVVALKNNDPIFREYLRYLVSVRYEERELLSAEDGEEFYNDVKEKSVQFENAELAAAGGDQSRLDPEVRHAIDFARSLNEYCDKALARQKLRDKVSSLQQKDDFENAMDIMQEALSLAGRVEDLKKDSPVKNQLDSLSSSGRQVKDMFSRSCDFYGQYGILNQRTQFIMQFKAMITKWRNAPEDLLHGHFDEESSIFKGFRRMYEFAHSEKFSDDKIDAAIKEMIAKHIPKTVRRNMDLIKGKMNSLCCSSEISEDIIADITNYLTDNPDLDAEQALSMAVEDVVYKNRDVQDEIDYCITELRKLQDADLQQENADNKRTNVMKRIATLELLKNKKDYKITGIKQLEKDALEFIKDKPNFFLNVCCSKNAVRDYLADPDKIANNFEYKIYKPDYNYDYEQAKINIRDDLQANGVVPPAIEDLKPAPMDELKKKAILQNGIMSQLPSNMFSLYDSLYGSNYPKAWARLKKFIIKTPQNTDDVKEALKFIEKFSENKKDEEGRTFAYRTLEDLLGRIKKLNYAELTTAAEKDFINNFDLFQIDWYLAYSAQSDIAPLCRAEGYQLNEEEKLLLCMREDQTRVSFYHKLTKIWAMANPFSEMIINNKNIEADFDGAFEGKMMGRDFYRMLENYYNAETTRIRFEEGKDIALARSGVLEIPDLKGYKLVSFDEQNRSSEHKIEDILTAALQSKIFSLQKGKEPARYYGYNKDFKEIVSSLSYDEVLDAMKSHSIELNIDPARKYSGAEYEAAFNDAYASLIEKIKYAPHVGKLDLARALVMQSMQKSIAAAKDEENFDALTESIINEELIAFRTIDMARSAEFNSYIESLGGANPGTNYLNYSINPYDVESGKIFASFNKIASDPAAVLLSWTKEFSNNNPVEIEALKTQLKDELSSIGIRTSAGSYQEKAIESILYKLALIEKNVRENKTFTYKDLEDGSRFYRTTSEGSQINNAIIPKSQALRYAGRVIAPKANHEDPIALMANGMQIMEQKQAPDYESPEAYFIKKYDLPNNPTEEEQRLFDEQKKEFLDLCALNDAFAYSDIKLRRSYSEIWDVQHSEELKKEHEKRLEQKNQKDSAGRRELKASNAKKYIARCFQFNFGKELTEIEKIKYERTKVLLGSESAEALEFQKEYICDLINRILALPDEKLALSGTEEAIEYLVKNWNDLYIVFETDNFLGTPNRGSKIYEDFDIPKDIIEVVRHKAALAETFVMQMDFEIKAKADPYYKMMELFKDASAANIGCAESIVTGFGLGPSAQSGLGMFKLARLDQESHKEKNETVNHSMDGHYLDPSRVRILAKAKDVSLSDMFVRLYREVLNADVTKDDAYRSFAFDIGGFKDIAEALDENSPEFAGYYQMLKDKLGIYIKEKLPQGTRIGDLPQADQTAVQCVRDFVKYAENKIAYLAVREQCAAIEQTLGIKENVLDDVIRAAKEVKNKSAAMDFALTQEEASQLFTFRSAASRLLSSAASHEGKYGYNNISLEDSASLCSDLLALGRAASELPPNYSGFAQRPDLRLLVDKLAKLAKTLPKTENEIGALIEERSTKTFYSNINNFRNQLKSFGYDGDIGDKDLVEKIKTELKARPQLKISGLLKEMAYEGRTLGKEVDFVREKLKRFDGKELGMEDFRQIARLTAFIEAYKDQEKDGPLPNEETVDGKIQEFFTNHPNALVNLTAGDPNVLKQYLSDPKSLYDEYVYIPEDEAEPDLQANYTAALAALQESGIDISRRNRKYYDIPFDASKRKAIREMSDERKLNSQDLLKKVANALGVKVPDGWERLSTYFLKDPVSSENIKYNVEFCKKLCLNPLEGNKSFREKQLQRKLADVINLNPDDLVGLSREELIEKWPKIKESWGFAFVLQKDGGRALRDAGIEFEKGQQAKLNAVYTHATLLFARLQQRMKLYGSPNENLFKQLNLTKSEMEEGVRFPAFESDLLVTGENAMTSEEEYKNFTVRYNAMKKAGVLDLPNQSEIKMMRHPAIEPKKPFEEFVGALYTENGPFKISEIGKPDKYYGFDKTGSVLFSADTLEDLDGRRRDFNIEIKTDPGREYSSEEYMEILKRAQVNLNQQISFRGEFTQTKDIARKIAIDRLVSKLSDPAFKMQNEGFFGDLVNEEYINANAEVIAASAPFKRMINSPQIGGAENGFLKKAIGTKIGGNKILDLFDAELEAMKQALHQAHGPQLQAQNQPQIHNDQQPQQVQNNQQGQPEENREELRESKEILPGDDVLIK